MKKILIIIIALAVVGGGVYYYIKNKESKENKLQDTALERTQGRGFQFGGLSEGTSKDLVIGEKVIVRGATNQDGSITAEMINVGVSEEDFRNFRGVQNEEGEGFNPKEFQNLSPEEMRERMQELRDSGNFPAREGGMVRGGSGNGFVSGEIINKDEVSIIIKLTDGGSKLVFYSDNTEIRIQGND